MKSNAKEETAETVRSRGRNCCGKVARVRSQRLGGGEAASPRDAVEQFASSHCHKFDSNRQFSVVSFRKKAVNEALLQGMRRPRRSMMKLLLWTGRSSDFFGQFWHQLSLRDQSMMKMVCRWHLELQLNPSSSSQTNLGHTTSWLVWYSLTYSRLLHCWQHQLSRSSY